MIATPPDLDIDLPSRSDPFVALSSGAIGGPVGEHARVKRRFWTPMRVGLLLACVTLALCWVQKSPCQDGRWQDFSQYRQMCYTDVFALYFSEGLNNGEVPYQDHAVEYPVLTGFMMGAVGLPVHAISTSDWFTSLLDRLHHAGLIDSATPNEGMYFYNLTSMLLALFCLLTIWAIVRSRPHRPWDAVMVALAPALVVTAFVNWDLLAVGLTTLALYAWGRRALVTAGILFGLAVAAKFYPLLILGPTFLLCVRARKLRDFTTTFMAAVVTWVAVNIPAIIANRQNWATFYTFSQKRGVDWGTLWFIGAHWPRGGAAAGYSFFNDLTKSENVDTLNTISTMLLVLACVGIAALALFARERPRVAQLGFLVVATFLLTNKVWSQQFVLWLIPLAVLAHPRWRAFLVWQACELLYFFGFYQIQTSTAGGKAALPPEAFVYFAAARWVSLAVLCGLVVYEILHPERDAVRAVSRNDPEGGVINDAPESDGLLQWVGRSHASAT